MRTGKCTEPLFYNIATDEIYDEQLGESREKWKEIHVKECSKNNNEKGLLFWDSVFSFVFVFFFYKAKH